MENKKYKIDREESKKMTGYASIDKPWLKYYNLENLDIQLPQKTIYQYMYDNNNSHSGRIAINYFGNKIEYKEMFKMIEKAVKSFTNIGVKQGEIVTLCTVTTPEIIYCVYALNRLGAIVHLIDPRTSEEGIIKYLKETNSKKLITIDPLFDKVKNIPLKLEMDKIIVISPLNSLPFTKRIMATRKKKELNLSTSFSTWETFIKNGQGVKNIHDVEYKKSSPAIIVHTGGTTGVPKGVLLSNDNLNAMAHQYRYSGMNLQPGQKFLNIITPSFAYGISNSIHLPLCLGMVDVIIPKFDPNSFDEYLLKYKPNHTLGVPKYWEILTKSQKLKNKDLSFLLSAGCGGDHLPEDTEQKILNFLKEHRSPSKVAKGYGMTEVSSAACVCKNECNEIGSVGIPLINSSIAIFEPETDKELQYNEIGEICINTPTMMIGYYKNEYETNKVIKTHQDGKQWIHTGDLGYIDNDGRLFVKGRIKRMIIKRGWKIFPSEIERIIKLNPYVEDCCVVGSFHPEFGQVPRAHIRFKEEIGNNVDNNLNLIYELCKNNLPEYAIPEDFIIEELPFPLTNMGKIDYKILEEKDNKKYKKTLKFKIFVI